MTSNGKIALCQIDPTVGDICANADLIIRKGNEAAAAGADLVVFPEMALTGYPPEDLLLHPHFIEAASGEAKRVQEELAIPAIFGSVGSDGESVFNLAVLTQPDQAPITYRKQRLPNYGVFDEQRYFASGTEAVVAEINKLKVGLSVCEDIWHIGSPTDELVAGGAQVIINISASPFHAGKLAEREGILSQQAVRAGIPILYCSLVGAQDELVFDGRSMAIDASGDTVGRALAFKEDTLLVDLANISSTRVEFDLEAPEEIESALQLGLRDYVVKNGFNGVVLGLSGGIDSAVVATLAVDALGAEKVHAAVMPSPWSSEETQQDARDLAGALGIELFEFPISGPMKSFEETLGEAGAGPGSAVAAENIQARIRGNLLMALSNSHGWLVVTTGNKSELAVGYSTLYGDAAGGFGLLKDVPKQSVYELARLRNSRSDSPIPPEIINRPPSAELKPGQKDEDSLPPYDRLDEILYRYVELREDANAIVSAGHAPEEVNRILRMVDLAEYKRRQYPPGVKITPLAFGRDRRMPMTNGWRNLASE